MRDGWVETTLDGIAEYINGYPFKPADLGQVGLPVIRIKQLLDPTEPVDRTKTDTPDRCLLRDGDIVFSWSGTLAVRIWNRGPAKLNQHLFRVVEKKNVYKGIIPLILDHAIEELEEKSHGTTMKHITKQTLLPHKILLPPLPEQKRIVDLISSVDSYIEALQQQLESAKKSRNAVLHELLTAGAEDWEYKILSDICEVRDGTHDSPKPSDEGFALVTSKNIKDGRLDLESAYLISPQDYEEVNKRSKVEQYNLLISMIGTIGEVIVVEGEPDFAIKNVGLLKSTDQILSRYLCHYLGSQLGKNAISLSVSGSTQKFISLGKLRVLPVLYPPMEDQKAIVEAMSLFDQQISKNLEVAARIKNLRSSLLSDLLSGEHEIPLSYDKVIGAV